MTTPVSETVDVDKPIRCPLFKGDAQAEPCLSCECAPLCLEKRGLYGQVLGRVDPPPVERAMVAHRREHPSCEACGRSPVAIHHIIPVAVDASKGDDPGNLMSLCPPCHIAYGHGGDPGCHHYVLNVREVLESRKVRKI